MKKIVPTKTFEYKKRKIWLYDDLFQDSFVKEFGDFMMYDMQYQARPSFDNELSMGIDSNGIKKIPKIYPVVERIIKEYNKGKKNEEIQRVSHGYGALITNKNHTLIHQDISCSDCITFLYYGNPVWKAEWGGETIFYNDEKSDSIFSITPKPGRLAVFHASIFHAAGVPKVGCTINRYGLSMFCRCSKMMGK